MTITREMELEMIRNPNLWPGETLCLKQRPKPGDKVGFMGYVAYGVLTSTRLPLAIYLQPDFIAERVYPTAEAMLDDGWIVD
jgi:hypothetical protein